MVYILAYLLFQSRLGIWDTTICVKGEEKQDMGN